MHILLIHQSFAAMDEAGGTRHIELARCLVERGHRVSVIASPVNYLTGQSHASNIQQESALTIRRAYTYPAFHKSFMHRVFSFVSFMISSFFAGLRIEHVDLVWGSSPPIFQAVTAWLVARLKGVPFLFEVRDLWPEFAIGVGVLKNPLLIRLSRWLERFLYRRADVVMVNSPGFVEHVKTRGARRVALIPNGADTAMFDPSADGAEVRGQHGLDGKFVIVYAGAHGLSNDLGMVLDAASLLREQSKIAFLLVGDGKDKPALLARAREMNLSNVVFAPPVPKTAIPAVLAAADACLAILKPLDWYKTTYPNKVFDYMAAGRPVLLAIEGVVRDVVETAGAGIAVQPGNPADLAEAAARLSADPVHARAMGLAGRAYIEQHFNRRALAADLAQLIEGMAKSNG